MAESSGPYQRFNITPGRTHTLRVTVVRGLNIKQKGTPKPTSIGILDKLGKLLVPDPDCYVTLNLPNTQNQLMQTKTINKQSNPEWNEVFEFHFNPKHSNTLEVIVYHDNIVFDNVLGKITYDIKEVPFNKELIITFPINADTSAQLELSFLKYEKDPLLRFGNHLSHDEQEFLTKRKSVVFEALKRVLGTDQAPKSEQQVPVIAVLGSGGGFRAMVGFSGVIEALTDSGLLDCATYVAGLSGSTWYLSWLYSHPEFPTKNASELRNEIKERTQQCPFLLLTPINILNYKSVIRTKAFNGQSVSLTDLFGLLVGHTLIKDRLDSKLSDQRSKLAEGKAPLPLYTSINVKSKVQARVYHEWMEFSPFEVGIPKYATYTRPEHFGSSFFVGQIVKPFLEYPLHYLQGIWGSAFAVLFQQIMWIIKTDSAGNVQFSPPTLDEASLEREINEYRLDGEDSNDTPTAEAGGAAATPDEMGESSSFGPIGSFLDNIMPVVDGVVSITTLGLLNTIGGRAAKIFNPVRGLSTEPNFKGDTVQTTPLDDENFKGLREPLSTDRDQIFLVDGGLGFNSPYAILLRPERKIQLFISFDFSSRSSDNTPPFKELLLAEEWAKKVGVSFPPVASILSKHQKEPIKEFYIFKDENDPNCPIIVHFVLINIKFKEFTRPGVKRESKEEKEFADFSLFDGATKPFSTYNFKYTEKHFEQLAGLTAFNVLSEIDTIKSLIADLVKKSS